MLPTYGGTFAPVINLGSVSSDSIRIHQVLKTVRMNRPINVVRGQYRLQKKDGPNPLCTTHWLAPCGLMLEKECRHVDCLSLEQIRAWARRT